MYGLAYQYHTSTKKLDPAQSKNIIRNLNAAAGVLLNQYSHNGFFSNVDRLSFQIQMENKQTLFTVTNSVLYILMCSPIKKMFMIRLVVLLIQTQDAKIIKKILSMKIAGQQKLKKFLWTMMMN